MICRLTYFPKNPITKIEIAKYTDYSGTSVKDSMGVSFIWDNLVWISNKSHTYTPLFFIFLI